MPAEVDLSGVRDRVLLLVGFVAALRRSELATLTLDRVAEQPTGAVLTLPRSKTNFTGENVELVLPPRAGNPDRCPVTALSSWCRPGSLTVRRHRRQLKGRQTSGYPNADSYQLLAYSTALGLPVGHLVYAGGTEPTQVYTLKGSGTVINQHALDLHLPPDALLESVQQLADHIAYASHTAMRRAWHAPDPGCHSAGMRRCR